MCGVFGIVSPGPVNFSDLKVLVSHSRQRGRDASGLLFYEGGRYGVCRADYDVNKLLDKVSLGNASIVLGHSRLITDGLSDNQPVLRDDIAAIHNGIIVNVEEAWGQLTSERRQKIDSELIASIAQECLQNGCSPDEIPGKVLELCQGVVACALVLPSLGKLILFSNNGSLYLGKKLGSKFFASESYPLTLLGCESIEQVREAIILDIPLSKDGLSCKDFGGKKNDFIFELKVNKAEEDMLVYPEANLRRCSKCILPETMPYISFDDQGICNYCQHYSPRNKPKPEEELFRLVEPYRRLRGNNCIVPFSGGRDSCYGLHLIVNELKLKPVTYTYDWGMITDLGRRNISRMCSKLGVENIIIAADLAKKRKNIELNLKAWLKSPNLGMISILTAGDKHFFRHIESIKKQTGINLNLWGINPLEITHFKAGFLGIKPYFEEEKVYSHGVSKQLKYQWQRFKAMLESPGYFNRSLWDTLSGEYYRSFREKKDYFHIFDYWRWDEGVIDETLLNMYDWETAVDTNTTWRIGDGTAAFYNYIYYTVVGFTEHDTFRSNQIREGDITREVALKLVADENQPRYSNIRWYLDLLGMDFKEVIKVINKIPRAY